MTGDRSLDPIVTTVTQRKLEAIAEEVATTILRTTRSGLLSQAGDLGAALLDADGRLLAGAEYIPIIALSLRNACAAVRTYFGDDIHPGDVILHNDVFSGGVQNSDTGALIPAFHHGELVGWVGAKGHLIDIGGPVPGGCNPLATEVWQEALRIPPVKVVDRGRPRRDVWDLIFANVRAPEVVAADVQATIGACQIGVRELIAVVDRFGLADFRAHADAMLDAGEQMMRRALEELPDGAYEGESFVNIGAGGVEQRHRVHVRITVRGDQIAFDYAGTAPQTEGYANAPLASSASATLMSLLMLIGADMPHNDGVLRPVEIAIPEGSMLNPRFPAATFYGNFMSVQNYEAIMSALEDALPDRVTAGWNRPYVIRTSGVDERTGRTYHDIHFLGLKGGAGAVHGVDGYSQGAPIFCPALRTHDYEINEVQDPHFIVTHEYLSDSAGAGRWRGGLGVEYACRVDAQHITAVTQGDGLLEGAPGRHGGSAGAVNRIELESADGTICRPQAMEILEAVAPGTTIRQTTGGGGGYGDPFERPVDAVVRDVENGFVSPAGARAYGVVVTRAADGGVAVDAGATAALRAGRRERENR